MPKSKTKPKDSKPKDSKPKDSKPKDSTLNPSTLGTNFLVNIRMAQPKPEIAYARYHEKAGRVHPVSPVGSKPKAKKPVFKSAELISPKSKKPVELSKIVANTPEGKTNLRTERVVGHFYTPTTNSEHAVVKLSSTETIFSAEMHAEIKKLKQKFLAECAVASEDASVAPEFRGGSAVLTAQDVKYRANKNKKTGGHRSLTSQPRAVMNKQSAKELAKEQGFLSKKFNEWDWGHLLPAGGSPQGAEVNLDPYNFLAVPDTLNTWQMVPEMMARHLAEVGFDVEYTCLARAEKTKTGEYGFVAKEIYCAVRLLNHGLKVEFFTTRDAHKVPCKADAMHLLSEFYKIAGKPEQLELKEKFEKALDEKLSEFKKESFVSPDEKTLVPAIKRPYMAPANGLQEDDVASKRAGFKPVLFRGTKKLSTTKISEDDFALLPIGSPVKKAKKTKKTK
jgi:hypothetical protein